MAAREELSADASAGSDAGDRVGIAGRILARAVITSADAEFQDAEALLADAVAACPDDPVQKARAHARLGRASLAWADAWQT
jgi:hypothetical protein